MVRLLIICCLFFACNNPLNMNDQFEKNNPEEYQIGVERMIEAKKNLHTLGDVQKLMKQFVYITEPIGWTPTIEVMFARNLADDCDGAAVLGEWALEQIGIPSRRCSLIRADNHHAIAISNDNSIMISNNEVISIPVNAWVEAVLTWFEPPYEIIVDGNRKWRISK